MFQRILIAWDGSLVARRALDVAIDLARRYGGELVAVSVAHSPAHAETAADRAESVQAARAYLEETPRTRRATAPSAPASTSSTSSSRATTPPRTSSPTPTSTPSTSIVAGHHRTGRAGRLLLRGLPERLVASAEVPVLIVGEAINGARAADPSRDRRRPRYTAGPER